jgi:hypothetical protein
MWCDVLMCADLSPAAGTRPGAARSRARRRRWRGWCAIWPTGKSWPTRTRPPPPRRPPPPPRPPPSEGMRTGNEREKARLVKTVYTFIPGAVVIGADAVAICGFYFFPKVPISRILIQLHGPRQAWQGDGTTGGRARLESLAD